MKVTPAHLDTLRKAIEPFDIEANRTRYRNRDIPRGADVKDIDTRYRWDLFYAATPDGSVARDEVRRSGQYTSTHLDTALRAIVRPL